VTDKEIIEALKGNELGICQMPTELREAMLKMDPSLFECLMSHSPQDEQIWSDIGMVQAEWSKIQGVCACRLRSDYEEKPEIVECEVKANKTDLEFQKGKLWKPVYMAVSYPDFKGFTDGEYLWGCMYKNKADGTMQAFILARDIEHWEVITPKAVLFRKA